LEPTFSLLQVAVVAAHSTPTTTAVTVLPAARLLAARVVDLVAWVVTRAVTALAALVAPISAWGLRVVEPVDSVLARAVTVMGSAAVAAVVTTAATVEVTALAVAFPAGLVWKRQTLVVAVVLDLAAVALI
jgi:hypothetical protein